jgi:dTDP-4-dehydrorhamnose reductase
MDIHSDSLVVRTNFYGWGTSYRRSFSDLILEHLTKREGIVLFDNVYYTPILIQSLAEAVHELIDIQAKGIINVV